MNTITAPESLKGLRLCRPNLATVILLGIGAACAGDPPLNGASHTIDLQVSQTVTNESPPENGLTSFVVLARNNSPIVVPDVIGGDTLSAGLEYMSHTTGAKGAYDPASRIWTIGNLAPNEEASLTVVARASAGTAGSQQFNVAGVIPGRSDFTDSNLANNISVANVTVGAPLPPTAFLNEPSGFVALTDRRWDTLTGDGWSYSGANPATGNYQSIVTLTGDDVPPVNGPDVLRGFYQVGTTNGHGTGRTFYPMSSDGGRTELFAGMWVKYDANFVGSPSSMKMFFFMFNNSTHRSFLAYDERPERAPGPTRYYAHSFESWASPTGGGVEFSPRVQIPYGEWTKMEWYWKKNSAPETADGILRVWMNGVLLGEITNAIWPGNITQFYHEGTHNISGGSSTFAHDMAWYVARTYISVPPG